METGVLNYEVLLKKKTPMINENTISIVVNKVLNASGNNYYYHK